MSWWKKIYATTHEKLCDVMTEGDEEIYVQDVLPNLTKTAFGRIFVTLHTSKNMEMFARSEYVRLEGAMTNNLYYLLGQPDGNKKLDSLVTNRDTVINIYGQICEHFLKLTGTSMMSLVVPLVFLSKYDQNDKWYSQGITNLRDLKQKSTQREKLFQEILYIAVFLMMMEPGSVFKDKLTPIVDKRYEEITLEEVIFTYTSMPMISK